MSIFAWLSRQLRKSSGAAPSLRQAPPLAPRPLSGAAAASRQDDPDAQLVLGNWQALREYRPDVTWAEFVGILESSKRRTETNLADRRAELARKTAKQRRMR